MNFYKTGLTHGAQNTKEYKLRDRLLGFLLSFFHGYKKTELVVQVYIHTGQDVQETGYQTGLDPVCANTVYVSGLLVGQENLKQNDARARVLRGLGFQVWAPSFRQST